MNIQDRINEAKFNEINKSVVTFQAAAHSHLGDSEELSQVVREFTSKLKTLSNVDEIKKATIKALEILNETFS